MGLIGGRVDVIGRDEPGARIEVHRVTGRPLEVSLVDGELKVGYPSTLGSWEGLLDRLRAFVSREDAADLHLAVPREVAVRLGTVTADGLLADVGGPASVTTGSGVLVTDSTRGSLSARSVSGDLVLRGHGGALDATSVSGSITASGRLGDVDVSTVSGQVTVDAERIGALGVRTVSADATVRVPAGLGLSVGGQSVSGRVVVDGVDHRNHGPGGGSFAATVGDGACRVRVSTVSGNVTVLRAGA